ncbi:MAG: GMP synthase (glutamine-hydrolyzing), partial [Deltaproteobacteria bacterium]|nr:GMP synthase (glutamine-hydrolyzing) [Deltaproteobacteria bacterium]
FFGLQNPKALTVWMSHGDRIKKLPPNFIPIARSSNSPIAACKNKNSSLFALQFHPEVVHTPQGRDVLSNFIFKVSKASPSWTMTSFIEHSVEKIKKQVGGNHVILGLSGGVDSSVTAFLLHKAMGLQLTLIFINNGLLRLNEEQKVIGFFQNKENMNLKYVDASQKFLTELKGVSDPEKKRKIIGRVFIEVFEEEAKKIPNAKFLAQGTLYPDVIESVSFDGGPSVTIKVRILGEITPERLDLIRKADHVVVDEIKKAGWYRKVWQSFAVLLPVKTVGVMGDERTYENVVALRAVQSEDGMTADWVDLPYDLLGKISNRMINEVPGVNRVVYDISSKPPSTIEWE